VRDVTDFCLAYGRNRNVDCRRHMHTTLRGFLRFAWRGGWLSRDLSAAVPGVRVYRLSGLPRPIGEEAVTALLQSLDRSRESGCRDAAIVQLLYIYGVRAVQVSRLCLGDIDWRQDVIRFPPAKGGRPISVPLLPEAGNAVAEYLRRFRRRHSGRREVFLSTVLPVRPLAAGTVCACISRRIQEAGIRLDPGVKAGSHAFRYACATRMLKAGFTAKVVADTLGHRDLNSVQIYNKLDTEALRAIALPWPGGVP
jgi:integrase